MPITRKKLIQKLRKLGFHGPLSGGRHQFMAKEKFKITCDGDIDMETYTIIKKGQNIRHCINIPAQFLDQDLEIIIKPAKKGGEPKKKLQLIFQKYKDIKPFESISDPLSWQKEQRNDW